MASSLVCTFDGGRTWSARPLLCTVALCALASLGGNQYVLANDGVVVAEALAPGNNSRLGLYRLPKGATTWQYLGATPGSNAYFFAPTPNGGILWTIWAHRAAIRYRRRTRADEPHLCERLRALAAQRPRKGYRRLHQAEGLSGNGQEFALERSPELGSSPSFSVVRAC